MEVAEFGPKVGRDGSILPAINGAHESPRDHRRRSYERPQTKFLDVDGLVRVLRRLGLSLVTVVLV